MTGWAFVPQTPHLLYLVIKKIKQPVGIETIQIKTILDCDVVDEKEEIWLDEKLVYSFPNQLRSEIISEPGINFTIESGFRFIKVMSGETISTEKTPVDLYTDILLYRDHETLLGQLALAGIEVNTVTMQRLDGTICYVVGKELEKGKDYASLWVEKDTFLPLKYVVEKNDWLVECSYTNWQKISRTWYPLEVNIMLDKQEFASVTVGDIKLKSGFPNSLFDISNARRLYPPKQDNPVPEAEASGMDELEKRIEEFKKLYE